MQELNSLLDRQESNTQSRLDQLFHLMSQKPSSLGGANDSPAGPSNAGGGDAAGAGL